jgi:hypothetical protein
MMNNAPDNGLVKDMDNGKYEVTIWRQIGPCIANPNWSEELIAVCICSNRKQVNEFLSEFELGFVNHDDGADGSMGVWSAW